MSEMKKYRWLVLVFVWAGVLSFSYINPLAIGKIISQRSEIEALRLDREFWQRNSVNITKVLDRQKSLYQEVESLKLAQVELIDKINGLIVNSGLSEVTIEPGNNASLGAGRALGIFFKGTFNNGMDVLSRAQKEFPYLSFQKVGISPEGSEVKFDTSVIYHYTLVTGTTESAIDQQL